MANVQNVKKGDNVLVITGKDKGKTATVAGVSKDKERVLLEGKGLTVNKKAVKARRAQDKGGIIDQPATVAISNVMPICAACGKATRVGNKEVDGKKVRVCVKCGAVLETKKVTEKKKEKANVRKKTKAQDAAVEVAATENVAEAKETTTAPAPKATVRRKSAKKADAE